MDVGIPAPRPPSLSIRSRKVARAGSRELILKPPRKAVTSGRTFTAMKRLLLLPVMLLLAQCSSPPVLPIPPSGPGPQPAALPPPVSTGMPQIINVSAYDPKERQRSGRSYSEHYVSALRANGASGLIARAGKGGVLDTKCAAFLASADRVGLLPGVYYRLQNHVSAASQADQFVTRAQSLARSRDWNAPLCCYAPISTPSLAAFRHPHIHEQGRKPYRGGAGVLS